MTKELDLLILLEKKLDFDLERIPLEKYGKNSAPGFVMNSEGNVVGLSICRDLPVELLELIVKFSRLEKLSLCANNLDDISFLEHLPQLTELRLDNNRIQDISRLKNLKNLTKLYLNSNAISDISCLAQLKELSALYLHKNRISDISCLKELTRLTILTLYGNQIQDISSLASLQELTALDLHENQISDISSLAGLKKLVTLYLANNQVNDISALVGLTSLEYLELKNNQVSHLPPELFNREIKIILKGGMNTPQGIFLEGNPLKVPPTNIIEQGIEAVKEYFKSPPQSKNPKNPVKNLVTSPVKRFLDCFFDKKKPS